MPSREAVNRFTAANRDIRTLALRELRAFFASLPEDAERAARALEEYLPNLVTAYGDVAASVAAEFFEEMRDQAGAGAVFRAILGDAPPAEAVQANARWAVGPMFGGTKADALARLDQVVDRMTLQVGRDTMARSIQGDPAKPRWARVPQGKTCAFCMTLASRGPIYLTEQTAGKNNKFHAKCDCTPTPIWDGDELPAGYDPDELYNRYLTARGKASGDDLKSILSVLREQEGIA